MISDHTQRITKYPCTIIVSDPKTKIVQGLMRDGGTLHLDVLTTDPFFRWPKTGEEWVVRQENGSWKLDSIRPSQEDVTTITSINPGDAHINVEGTIHTSSGTTVPQKYSTIVGDGAKKAWTIKHNLNTYAVVVVAVATASPNAPITAFTWAPAIVGGKGDLNNTVVTFTVAPLTKGAQVVLIG